MLRVAALALPLALLAPGSPAGPYYDVPLYSEAVAVERYGIRALVPPGERPAWVGRTRATDVEQAAVQLAWLGARPMPGPRAYKDLARTALLDLHVLRLHGAPVAGWTPYWRYVWPRDASFVAAAFARTGRVDDARDALLFLQRVQAPDGSFHARYEPDGSGPPDDRAPQADGPAWALWALAALADADPTAVRDLGPLRDRSAARLLRRGLAPSSDYWERRETRLTLGIAAPVLAGLDAAAYLYGLAGDVPRSNAYDLAADRTADELVRRFAPRFPRYAGGRALDAAVTFLLPPFQRRALPGAQAAVTRARDALRQPAGGVSPGEAWHDDGVSWTPETALFALVAAATGDDRTARRELDWLAAHRTREGALPEKVAYDGSPGAVAPLAWTAALVVLALDALS